MSITCGETFLKESFTPMVEMKTINVKNINHECCYSHEMRQVDS